jgi:ferritin-like metal-binding protein YciE
MQGIEANREQLIRWLNDAHAMELGLAEVLDRQARDAWELIHVQEKLRAHAMQTRHQAERLKSAIAMAGGSVSTAKSWFGDIMGRLEGMSAMMYRDSLVKSCLMDFAAEQFEIACYESLIAAANLLALPNVTELCRQSLDEEREMARWLQGHIEEVTNYYLLKEGKRAAA